MSIVKQSLVGASGQGGGYTINDSLRFRRSASAYLSRTPASAGNRRTWTWSGWVKRGKLGDNQNLFSVRTGSTTRTILRFASDSIDWLDDDINFRITTSAVYRDPSAWYHIIAVINTTQATSTNRLKLYVNGEQVTSLSNTNYPSQNYEAVVNSTLLHAIGREGSSSNDYLDGYMTEINLIDGQALDPTDFGEFDDNGTWKPLAYEGTYGTNGFYLNGVGVTDQSGNGNNWTNNNLNLSTSTATTYDQMKDTPSLVDENAGNFAVLNPLNDPRTYVTYSDGNLTAINTTAALHSPFIGTIGMAANSGKYYWEVIGVGDANTRNSTGIGTAASMNTTTVWSYVAGQAGFFIGGAASVYYSLNGTTLWNVPWVSGNVIQYAYDANTGKFWAGQNNVWYNSTGGTTGDPATGANPTSTLSNTDIQFPGGTVFNQGVGSYLYHNFGQRPFAYTPPTGFKKLNTFNLPDSTIKDGSDYFNTVLYSGSSASEVSVTGVGFQPDLVWDKNRTYAYNHYLWDAVRGATKYLSSNLTNAETTDANSLKSFDSDGFTLGAGATFATMSAGNTHVGWAWKANGSGVSNTVGTIPSTVSVNTTSGFSIVSYTGNSTSGATVGHGLGIAPEMVIVKQRSGGTQDWAVYHKAVPATKGMYLNLTNVATTSSSFWNNTAPTSSVITLGSGNITNGTNDYIAYCFHSVEGYSAFGSYTGNGSTDGPFVYTGFRPRYLMIKRTDVADAWAIKDTARDTYNVDDSVLKANENTAESTSTFWNIDILSNGFKLRNLGSTFNNSGGTYTYMAFAENPFKNANAR